MYNGLRMLKALSNLIFAIVVLVSMPAFAQLPNRDSVIIDSMNLLRPIHFSRDTGSEVRATRRAYIRLLREKAWRDSAPRRVRQNEPFLTLDSIWRHNESEREILVEKLLTTIKDTTTDYHQRLKLIYLLSSTGHPKALRFLMQNIGLIEYISGGSDGGEHPLALKLAHQQDDPWTLLTPMMESICEDPHEDEGHFPLFADLLYRITNYDPAYSHTLVLIFLKKTQSKEYGPNPQLLRFYEYLKRE